MTGAGPLQCLRPAVSWQKLPALHLRDQLRARDADENLIKMPAPIGKKLMMMNAPLADLSGEHRANPLPPETYRLVADIDAMFEQQIFDLAQRQRHILPASFRAQFCTG